MINKPSPLIGAEIKNRWTLVAELSAPDGATGSNFSRTFKGSDKTNQRDVFVKIVDIEKAFKIYAGSMPITELLEKIAQEHSHESSLAELCGERKMNRVVRPISSGELIHSSVNLPLPYIVFEWAAEGDTHKIISTDPVCSAKASWWLRTLHNAAVGIKQLHSVGIAHQDVKPSNLVFFQPYRSKITDLGRAVQKKKKSHNDDKNGDPNHAPPELYYSVRNPVWETRFLSQDLYMLGSLAFWFFSGYKSFTKVLMYEQLDSAYFPSNFRGSFTDVLPILEINYSRILEELKAHVPPEISEDFVTIIGQLCHPDPNFRGHPRQIQSTLSNQYSLERYITQFIRLAKKLEVYGK